ncbi:MAG: ATP-binding protein [Paenacidovorax caeni]
MTNALVGATAPGLGDLLPAPVGLQVHHMPNVELVAHILNNALTDVRIQPASGLVNSIFNLVPVGLALWALAALGPSAALMGCIGLAIAMLAFAGLSWIWQVMLSPAAGLAGIAMAYPLWSWRRLSAATRFLELEMKTLRREGLPISLAEDDLHRGDFLERRIRAVEQASEHLRNLHHFVSTSLQQLPSPTFVCDAQGRVLLANAAAALHLGIKVQDIHGALLPTLLQKLVADDSGQPLLQESQFQTGTLPPQSEGRDADGRSMLLLAKPFTAPPAQGWLITLVDLTDMRQAQKQRDQAMHFISHDIRAPIGSILTLLEMQREYPDQMPASELMARIERYAQASLALAENFVHLASAKYHAYQFAPVDLAALLEEAVDDAWAALREHKLSMDVVMEEDCAYCMGDRALLSRAITNILGNAIKFSPEGGKLSCALSLRAESWVLVVRDQGPGISAKDQQRLFLPFERMHSHSHPSVAGAGLGLAFVHTVVLRHGGSIEVESQEGQGAEFRLVLPRTQVAPPEDLTDTAG